MTPEEGLRMQIEGYRRMTGQQRSQVGFELYELAHEMVTCAVQQQHPDWDREQVRQEVQRRFRLAERIHSSNGARPRIVDNGLRDHGINRQ